MASDAIARHLERCKMLDPCVAHLARIDCNGVIVVRRPVETVTGATFGWLVTGSLVNIHKRRSVMAIEALCLPPTFMELGQVRGFVILSLAHAWIGLRLHRSAMCREQDGGEHNRPGKPTHRS
jgi:hypothetical protein